MTSTHGRYDFCTDITDPVLDGMILFADFECEVSVDLEFRDGEPVATCTDVFLDGKSIRGGNALSALIRLKVMEAADEEMAAGGHLWDAVAAREGISLTGHPNDPDTHWQQAW